MRDEATPGSPTLVELLARHGMSRRGFLKFCATASSLMALPPSATAAVARALEHASRPSVIWLSLQECTGCTESLTRSDAPSFESLILRYLSLDYHHTLQAASGSAAERARLEAMHRHAGRYLLVVDGSLPLGDAGYCTIAGTSAETLLREMAEGAAAVIAVGSCASFGGIPAAEPNPTGARAISELLPGRTVVNVSGCPPIPVVISGVLMHYLAFGSLPELDDLGRPLAFYGNTIHQRCPRRGFYDKEQFAEAFDDEGARKGWCLLKLGCKGPYTHNACPTLRWNQGTSFPILAGHGCIGCSEPGFWDDGPFYEPLFEGYLSAWWWWLQHPGGKRATPPHPAR
jgi:hydrogenase small subunit